MRACDPGAPLPEQTYGLAVFLLLLGADARLDAAVPAPVRLLLTLLYQLRRTGKSLGCASACIGGGQGIAMILESL